MLRTYMADKIGWHRAWKYRHWIDPNWCEGYKNLNQPSRKVLCERILESDPVRVLEVGCGMGANLLLLHKMEPNLELVGVDISPYAVLRARFWLPDEIEVYECSFKDLPSLIIEPFDIVFTSDAFMYAKDKPSALKNMLAIGDRVILYEWKQILEVVR